MQGFLLDDKPKDYTWEDYERAFWDFGVSAFTNFVTSMAILRLIYVKNKDVIRGLRRKK
jgi:hypothetical protein